MVSVHDYSAAVCLPGYASVKLWLSESYAGDIRSRDAQTHHGHGLIPTL